MISYREVDNMPQSTEIASPWRGRQDREQERAEKRAAVLHAAVRLFNVKGFHATSLDDVAASLSVTKPTIYHYFSSKDEILFECVRLGLDEIREVAARAAAEGGSGLERLRKLIRAYALIKTRDFGMCVSRTTDDQLGPESRAQFRAIKREIHEILQTVLIEGMEDGSISPGDPRLTAFTVAGALNWIARWYVTDGAMTPQEIAAGMAETFTQGLAPRD